MECSLAKTSVRITVGSDSVDISNKLSWSQIDVGYFSSKFYTLKMIQSFAATWLSYCYWYSSHLFIFEKWPLIEDDRYRK